MKSAEKDRWACPPAGCSTLSWETEDGKHIWGRNFDYNRLAEGSQVTFCPSFGFKRLYTRKQANRPVRCRGDRPFVVRFRAYFIRRNQ